MGCDQRASYGKPSTNKAECCARHARAGMVNVVGKTRGATTPDATSNTHPIRQPRHPKGRTLLCSTSRQVQDGMVNVVSKGGAAAAGATSTHLPAYPAPERPNGLCSARARQDDGGCPQEEMQPHRVQRGGNLWQPRYAGKAERSTQHAEDGMVDARRKRCGDTGCNKQPSYSSPGTTKAERVAQHAQDGMADVRSKRRKHRGCNTGSSFGSSGTRKAERCARHAEDEMINITIDRRRSAAEKQRGGGPPSIQTENSSGGDESSGGLKRARVIVDVSLAPSPVAAEVGDGGDGQGAATEMHAWGARWYRGSGAGDVVQDCDVRGRRELGAQAGKLTSKQCSSSSSSSSSSIPLALRTGC